MDVNVWAAILAGCLCGVSGSAAAGTSAAAATRILYVSDWSGTKQIYAADPSGRRPTGQLTAGRAPTCVTGSPCGFARPAASPDGRRVAYWDDIEQGRCKLHLFIARADGRSRRSITVEPRCPWEVSAVWSPDSRRLAYTGSGGLSVVAADGSGNLAVAGSSDRSDAGASWSPDGRALAFLSDDALVVAVNRTSRQVARDVRSFAWSPRGDRIAYTGKTIGGVRLVRPDGSGVRLVAEGSGSSLAWSSDGRFLAWEGAIVEMRTGRIRHLGAVYGIAWSPRRPLLAVVGADGIRLLDATTGAERRISSDRPLELAWSPDGGSLAYVTDLGALTHAWPYGPGDLRIASVSGSVRTVVAAAGRLGGGIRNVSWTKPPAGVQYRTAAPRTLATVTGDGVTTTSPVTALAADGNRVAYVSCGHVFVWTLGTRSVVQAEPSASLAGCRGSVYTLAISDGRVVFGLVGAGIGRYWWLGGLAADRRLFSLGGGTGTRASPLRTGAVGEAVGSGRLLVFSSWTEDGVPGSSIFTREQTIRRVGAGGCPCPGLRTEPGPLVPFDVEGDRIVAGGDNATVVLDGDGRELLSIPVRSLAAQIDGASVVVLVQRELHTYDAGSGALTRRYPMGDVTAGRACGSPNTIFCPRPVLRLEDVAHGLVAYVLDGELHLLRLVDGADAVVGPGTLARFADAGLVYATGSQLRLVGYDRLPLR